MNIYAKLGIFLVTNDCDNTFLRSTFYVLCYSPSMNVALSSQTYVALPTI